MGEMFKTIGSRELHVHCVSDQINIINCWSINIKEIFSHSVHAQLLGSED